MPDSDLIKRGDAKASISDLFNKPPTSLGRMFISQDEILSTLDSLPAAEGAAGERVESHAESIPQDPRILNQVRRILGNRGFTGYEKYRDSPDGKPSKWLSDDVAVDDDYNSP